MSSNQEIQAKHYVTDVKRIVKDFTYHAPKPDQVPRYNALRDAGKSFALAVMDMTPPSREQSLALTHIEDAVMWANAAIARNELTESPTASDE